MSKSRGPIERSVAGRAIVFGIFIVTILTVIYQARATVSPEDSAEYLSTKSYCIPFDEFVSSHGARYREGGGPMSDEEQESILSLWLWQLEKHSDNILEHDNNQVCSKYETFQGFHSQLVVIEQDLASGYNQRHIPNLEPTGVAEQWEVDNGRSGKTPLLLATSIISDGEYAELWAMTILEICSLAG